MTPLDDLKLPQRVKHIIEQCRRGNLLMLTIVNLQGGGQEKVYTFYPVGRRRVPTISAEEAIASGELIPNRDGLLEDASQTFRAKP